MLPILFQWGDFFIPSWHFFYLLGSFFSFFLLGCFFRRLSRVDTGITKKLIIDVYLLVYLSGYFGARIFSLLIENEWISLGNFFQEIFLLGSMTFYGGVIAASASVFFFLWRRKKFFLWPDLLDFFVPAAFGGLFLGRIGCFLNGDDYGISVSDLGYEIAPWWGVVIPSLNDGVTRVPVQMFESMGALLILLLLWSFYPRLRDKLGPGNTGLFGAMAYGVLRFFLEYYRDDARGHFLFGVLSPAQTISLVIVCVSFWIMLRRRPPLAKV